MSSLATSCSPFCTGQLHDYSCLNYPQSRPRRGANPPRTPSNNQRTVLEPPLSPTGRPSSPRHYTTTPLSSLAPNSLPPPPTHFEAPPAIYDPAEVTLPNLRPEDPFSYAQGIGWSPRALEHLGNLATSEDSIFASLADVDFSSPPAYRPLPFAPLEPQERRLAAPRYQPASTSDSTPADSYNSSFTSSITSSITSNNPTSIIPTSPDSDPELFIDRYAAISAQIVDQILTDGGSSFAPAAMPSTSRRPRTASITIQDSSPAGKRRRISDAGRAKLNPAPTPKVEGSLPGNPVDGFDTDDNAPFMIDLTGTNNELTEDPVDAPPAPKEEDKRIKLSAFQCVICMDDVSTLTLTHCGHMYCAQCLHSSLTVEATKGKCPMCRQKIEIKPRESYTARTKGFWPLELKLMTSTRKGKRKAANLS